MLAVCSDHWGLIGSKQKRKSCRIFCYLEPRLFGLIACFCDGFENQFVHIWRLFDKVNNAVVANCSDYLCSPHVLCKQNDANLRLEGAKSYCKAQSTFVSFIFFMQTHINEGKVK